MKCLFVRHGNTFEAGQTPVWIGARTDLPLTAKGREQARAVGTWCADAGFAPAAVMAGPLRRTRETAAIIRTHVGGELLISDSLREIDYGAWEGLTSAQIERAYGVETLRAWERRAVWPEGVGWPHPEAEFRNGVLQAMASLRRFGEDANVILCTSNGVLRTIAKCFDFAVVPESLSVGTGRMCLVEGEPGMWRALGWNAAP